MGTVRIIFVLSLATLVFGACESASTTFEQSQEPRRPEVNPVEDEGRKTPPPRGFVADTEKHILHRVDCPLVSEIEGKYRQYDTTPWPGLNRGCRPCEKCQPLEGRR